MSTNLRIPQGTEAFYLGEASLHQHLLRSFEDRCSLWGYLPVTTPVYDYYEVYRGLLGDEREADSFKLVDREGELLLLRPDVTLFLARQMARVLKEDDLPMRAYYGDAILRHEDPHDLSKNEFYQVGAELIGAEGLEADAEILLLLIESLQAWGDTASVVHIGHRRLLAEHPDPQRLAAAVSSRSWRAARELLAAGGLPDARIDELIRLYRFIGSAVELEALVGEMHGLTTSEHNALNHLHSLVDACDALGVGRRIRIDLSEVGNQTYHSGVVFRAYAPDVSAPLARGGRYDGLLSRFGFAAPSVGFSIMLRLVQARHPGIDDPEAGIERITGEDFVARVQATQQLRAEGKAVRL
ncbi:MAG: ATP phosphoribosyltransferase regulatory subunit [Spirochaetales bacterium]